MSNKIKASYNLEQGYKFEISHNPALDDAHAVADLQVCQACDSADY
jgi:hypothetical protein